MAIVEVVEMAELRDGEQTKEYVCNYKRAFRVRTDGATVYQPSVLAAIDPSTLVAVPDLYDAMPGHAAAKCISRRARQIDGENAVLWLVECDYSTKYREFIENPLLRPVKISWSGTGKEVFAEKDVNGRAFLNAAKDKFDPPPAMEKTVTVCTIKRNEATFNPIVIDTFRGKINANPFMGAAAETVLCYSIDAGDEETENGITYTPVTYVFHRDMDGWKTEVLNAGFQKLVGNEKEIIYDKYGQPFQKEQPLTAAGDVLDPADDPTFITFTLREAVDFAPLNLG